MTKAVSNELLPCPFCGNAPTLYFGHVSYAVAYVRCDHCRAQTGNHNGETDREAAAAARGAWNRRDTK